MKLLPRVDLLEHRERQVVSAIEAQSFVPAETPFGSVPSTAGIVRRARRTKADEEDQSEKEKLERHLCLPARGPPLVRKDSSMDILAIIQMGSKTGVCGAPGDLMAAANLQGPAFAMWKLFIF